ncbi:hypothetical protein DFH07DRAFT_960057 [Mycena maculata]|uniref:Uncharacterized protein n=1 Tax=Mycena maculata TaxID=230809 RepID=A0AAD7J0H5_9AGAR|nr:hypothetical protein DFH07DRAFT_960057 [Mycena maculata]
MPSQVAMGLVRIEELITKLDRAAIKHLSRLPALRSLDLEIPDLQHLGSSASVSQPHPFPALRNLSFFSSTIDFAVEFLDVLSDCSLSSFRIGTEVLATKFIIGQLYSALPNHLSHTALESLLVRLTEEGYMPTPQADMITNYVINGRILAPLFYFRNLTSISLSPPVGFDIYDATAWEIARAWPKLCSLELSSATGLHHPSRITLDGLRAFAKHCEALTCIAITVDASVVPQIDDNVETRLTQSSLLHFDVGRSPILDPSTIAQFTSGLFPCLETIDTHNEWLWDDPLIEDEDGEMAEAHALHQRWKEVEALLPNTVSNSVS